MFEDIFNMLKKQKAQTAVEVLIIISGILIVAVVVVMIFISTGSAKADDITKTDTAHQKLLDNTIFPPTLDSIKLTDSNDTNVTIQVSITESPSSNIKDYCLVVNDNITNYCNSPGTSGNMVFNIPKETTNYYSVSLVSRSNQDKISSSSFVLTGSIATVGTGGTDDTGETGPLLLNFTCPTGYAKVPGLAEYNTIGDKNGFCVMKWEAKINFDNDPLGLGDINTSCEHFVARPNHTLRYGIWDIMATGCRITSITNRLVSTAEGYPIGNVNQNEARNYCQGLATSTGKDYHLITNNEWMTIARNIEDQNVNWISGAVGVGPLKKGNTYGRIPAIPGEYGVSCVISAVAERWLIDYVGAPCSASPNHRNQLSLARLVLSTGDEIWDFSGNMEEWVDKTVYSYVEPKPIDEQNYSSPARFEFTLIDRTKLHPSFPENQYRPKNLNWNSIQGVGQIFSHWRSGNATHGILRGGRVFLNNGPTGIYTIDFYTPTTRTIYAGFRCVYVP